MKWVLLGRMMLCVLGNKNLKKRFTMIYIRNEVESFISENAILNNWKGAWYWNIINNVFVVFLKSSFRENEIIYNNNENIHIKKHVELPVCKIKVFSSKDIVIDNNMLKFILLMCSRNLLILFKTWNVYYILFTSEYNNYQQKIQWSYLSHIMLKLNY